MPIPLDGRIFWVGTNASIPANWSRDTNFDDKFIQVDNDTFVSPSNAGNVTHVHTIVAHIHTANSSHTHTFSAAASSGGTCGFTSGNILGVTACNHTHPLVTSNATTITFGTTVGGDDTSGGTALRPPHIRVIVIKPDDANQEVPSSTDAIVFSDAATLGSFDIAIAFNDRFALGMTTNQNGGGLSGGTHEHTSPSHTHNADVHNHATINVGAASTVGASSGGGLVPIRVHHTLALDNAASTVTDSANPTLAAKTAEPSFTRLMAMENGSGVAATPDGTIIGYVGNASTLESGWELFTAAFNKQIKFTDTSSEIGDTGGSNTHSHTLNHSHTVTGNHTHSGVTQTDLSGSVVVAFGFGTQKQNNSSHSHVWSVSATTDNDTTLKNISSSSVDGRYFYRTLVLIKSVPTENFMMGCNF